MRSGKCLSWAGALILTTAGGCGVCEQLALRTIGSDGTGFATVLHAPMPMPAPAELPVGPAPQPVPPNEQITQMAHKVSAAEDDRKALTARVELLEQQVVEKDKALVQGNIEVREATQEIQNARQEMQRWKQEAGALRAKMQSVEKENRETLEAVIRSMEQVVEHGPGQGPSLPKFQKVQ